MIFASWLGLGEMRIGLLRVSSDSMRNTIADGDYIVVNPVRSLVPRELRRCMTLSRGQIVVAERPNAGFAVKRVVAIGGDTVLLRPNGAVINGVFQQEPYVRRQFESDPGNAYWPKIGNTLAWRVRAEDGAAVVPKGAYLLVGDDRAVSDDSRSWGPTPGDDIVGTVVMVAGRGKGSKIRTGRP